MSKFIGYFTDRWLSWALLSSALMLAIAHGFETFGGYAPCSLCLQQRTVYWVAGAIAIIGLILTSRRDLQRFRGGFNGMLALTFAVGMVLALYHAGAEWKWWPGPTTCASAGGKVDLAALAAIADGTAKIKPPACDQAAWRLFGLSMAGYNVLISLKLSLLSLMAAFSRRSFT
ncbi:MAG: disulfide bond formation protein B [Phenylobacterium zucineum]|nr:MAG: disulfide bond formation protein B [Phenylobacterium zucineum]